MGSDLSFLEILRRRRGVLGISFVIFRLGLETDETIGRQLRRGTNTTNTVQNKVCFYIKSKINYGAKSTQNSCSPSSILYLPQYKWRFKYWDNKRTKKLWKERVNLSHLYYQLLLWVHSDLAGNNYIYKMYSIILVSLHNLLWTKNTYQI